MSHRARQGQRLSHYEYPRHEERREGHRATSGNLDGAMMYVRYLVTSDFAVRSREKRAAQASEEQGYSKAIPVILAPSGTQGTEMGDGDTSGSYRDAIQSFADRKEARSSAYSSSSEK